MHRISSTIRMFYHQVKGRMHSFRTIESIIKSYDGPQPTLNLVSAPVAGFSPVNVGFLHNVLMSNIPSCASEKSAFSTFAFSKLVPVNTAFLNIVPFKELPLKLARSTIALLKSAPSNVESILVVVHNFWVLVVR